LSFTSNVNTPASIKTIKTVETTKNINTRVRSYQTGSPFRDYSVVYSIKHPLYLQAEKKIKEQMHYFASEIRNEWFKVDLQIAKDRLIEQLDNYFYGECDHSQKYEKELVRI